MRSALLANGCRQEAELPTEGMAAVAAKQVRDAALKLRARGLSVSDTAKVMGVSRGRVSQILKPKPVASARASSQR